MQAVVVVVGCPAGDTSKMSVILLSGRKKAIANKKQKVIRKVGKADKSGNVEVTAAWNLKLGGRPCNVSFSRDTMHVYVDGVHAECTAYITDSGFDLDLLFDFEGHRGHIYSDVEGSQMTNYLFIDDECIAQQKAKDCVSKHPGSKS